MRYYKQKNYNRKSIHLRTQDNNNRSACSIGLIEETVVLTVGISPSQNTKPIGESSNE